MSLLNIRGYENIIYVMVGDFILFIKKILLQHFRCVHKYCYKQMKCHPFKDYQECCKCGRTKF